MRIILSLCSLFMMCRSAGNIITVDRYEFLNDNLSLAYGVIEQLSKSFSDISGRLENESSFMATCFNLMGAFEDKTYPQNETTLEDYENYFRRLKFLINSLYGLNKDSSILTSNLKRFAVDIEVYNQIFIKDPIIPAANVNAYKMMEDTPEIKRLKDGNRDIYWVGLVNYFNCCKTSIRYLNKKIAEMRNQVNNVHNQVFTIESSSEYKALMRQLEEMRNHKFIKDEKKTDFKKMFQAATDAVKGYLQGVVENAAKNRKGYGQIMDFFKTQHDIDYGTLRMASKDIKIRDGIEVSAFISSVDDVKLGALQAQINDLSDAIKNYIVIPVPRTVANVPAQTTVPYPIPQNPIYEDDQKPINDVVSIRSYKPVQTAYSTAIPSPSKQFAEFSDDDQKCNNFGHAGNNAHDMNTQYNYQGYNSQGYNSQGYNHQGYNHYSYPGQDQNNNLGYDHQGYNQNSYNNNLNQQNYPTFDPKYNAGRNYNGGNGSNNDNGYPSYNGEPAWGQRDVKPRNDSKNYGGSLHPGHGFNFIDREISSIPYQFNPRTIKNKKVIDAQTQTSDDYETSSEDSPADNGMPANPSQAPVADPSQIPAADAGQAPPSDDDGNNKSTQTDKRAGGAIPHQISNLFAWTSILLTFAIFF